MFYYRLDIFLFLLLAVLLFDIFCRAITEVISTVLFKDDVSMAGPGIADLCDKALNFRFDLRLPDLISLNL